MAKKGSAAILYLLIAPQTGVVKPIIMYMINQKLIKKNRKL